MRLAEHRADPGANEAPSVGLLKAVKDAQRTFILGEPGAGKSAALQRLAWGMGDMGAADGKIATVLAAASPAALGLSVLFLVAGFVGIRLRRGEEGMSSAACGIAFSKLLSDWRRFWRAFC